MKRWRSGKKAQGSEKKEEKPNPYRCDRPFGVCENVEGGHA